ncbi:MAG: copper chaperone PCu(A)C [Gammaproteobacteria bacterium]|nr:copper chaperone PCu(A)C [Gammaproteobacteria bacterium]MBT8151001.1 copper chaperone PCu(A)C [Gammaproteobacteria bacterium]RZV57087.1 MAG: copper chaperone PCu(A)C [Pseudomonadales bacterium]
MNLFLSRQNRLWLVLAQLLLLAQLLVGCGQPGQGAGEPTNEAEKNNRESSAGLQASNGWMRLPPPGRDVTSAYITLSNPGNQDQVLRKFSAAQLRAIELHEHSHRDGMMQMRHVPNYVIAAGDTLEMQPGGHHLMLFGLSPEFTEQSQLAIELEYGSGDNVNVIVVPVTVRDIR